MSVVNSKASVPSFTVLISWWYVERNLALPTPILTRIFHERSICSLRNISKVSSFCKQKGFVR